MAPVSVAAGGTPADAAASPVAATATAPITATSPVAAPALPTAATAPTSLALAERGDVVAWEDLPKYLDHDFEITTSRMGTRDVILVAADAGEITVSGSVQGGRVQNRIYRDGFIRAVFIR